MNIIGFDLFDLFAILAKELSKRPLLRKKLLIISGVFGAISVTVLVVNDYLSLSNKELIRNVSSAPIAIFLLCFIISIYSFYPNLKIDMLEKLNKIANEKHEIVEKIEKGNEENVQEVIKLNLKQLDEYYATNIYQSKSSYNFSIIMTTLGFVLIIVSIFMFFKEPDKYPIPIITGLAGLISEFIGATVIILYKESTKHIDEFFNKLISLQKIMLAIELAEKAGDKKVEQISNIISGLMKSDEKLKNEKA